MNRTGGKRLRELDYYPFGMGMPGRKYSAEGGYRYGFNGKENDNEVKGEGNQQDYGMRIYDPRLGKFLSVDPLTKEYKELSPYQFGENSPIAFIDLDGLEKRWYLRDSKYGGKPVLTFGLGNLAKIDKLSYEINPAPVGKVGTYTFNTLATAWNNIANGWNDAMDGKTGADALRESVHYIEKLTVDDLKRVETYENLGAAVATGWGIKKLPLVRKIKLVAELPPGTKVAGISFGRGRGQLFKKAGEFKLTHSVETITKSADYAAISKLSDADLISSAIKPSDYMSIVENTATGKLYNGNTRIYELQRRGLNDVQIPYELHHADNSMFPTLKEPPKKSN